MSETASSVEVLIDLLGYAARGAVLSYDDYQLVHDIDELNGRLSDPVLHKAVHFLQHYQTDEDIMERDRDYRDGMMERAAEHIGRIKEKYKEAL